ncbi:MAG TPA: YhgE/Pip domain-containing protein [Pseudonocardiaceae bacterium]|jgi:putative membrane protein|nr:YhgE/Pip domain-containing protein [Pseudonocardiaceae bacterium]
MRALKLARFEFARFHTPLQRVALLFVVLVPLLYGGLYLWSNWDPYGKLNQIPVAVVNDDQPVTVNNQRVAAGELFVDELRKDPIFDWHFVSDSEAQQGVHDTRYYFMISVPHDFSKKLASGAAGTPQRAGMLITLDDANGYIVGKMAETVQSELENKISAAAVSAYFESVFGNLQRLRDGITQATSGADQLRDNLATAQQGSGSLVSGLTQLKSGADQLAPGAQQVSDGVNTIAGIVVPIANAIADAIPTVTQNAATAANAAANLASTAAQATSTVAGNASSVQARVTQLGQDHPELQSDPAYQQLVQATTQAATLTGQVNTAAGQVKDETAAVASAADTLAADAPKLQAQAKGAASQIQQLANGAKQVATGAAALDTGLGTALTGATQLDTGIGQLHDGATQLASGLANAQSQLPVLSPQQQKDNAATLASPVDVAVANLHPADDYGRGLTPFFFSIALWVFGITGFLILRAVSHRALASRAGNITVAIAGYLPAGAACVFGGLLLYLVVDWGLGLNPVHPWEMAGLMSLAAAAFTAIAHFFRVLLGGVASAVMLILLLLQLTTCAGTYPYETLPTVFKVLHPILPMTYLVDGLRVTITGGNSAHLVRDTLVLAAFGIVAMGLTVLAVKMRREWRIKDLKPELAI